MQLNPFRFVCEGVVRSVKVADADSKTAYLTLMVGGLVALQFRLGAHLVKHLQAGQEVEVSGAVQQSSFKGQTSNNFEAHRVRELAIEEPLPGSAGAPTLAKVGAKS